MYVLPNNNIFLEFKPAATNFFVPNIVYQQKHRNMIPIISKKIIDKPTAEDIAARKCGIGA